MPYNKQCDSTEIIKMHLKKNHIALCGYIEYFIPLESSEQNKTHRLGSAPPYDTYVFGLNPKFNYSVLVLHSQED